jgi:uncharacterized protein YuzE
MGTQGRQIKRQELVFGVEDPHHQIVGLEWRTWNQYIAIHHPEIAGTAESALRKLIAEPSRMRSTTDKGVAAFEDGALKALVLYDDDLPTGGTSGRVTTIYPDTCSPASGYYKAALNYRAPLYCRAPVRIWKGKVRRRPVNESMTLDYDQSADVLYITFADRKTVARYLETARGQILRLNKQSGKVLSCTIPMFSLRALDGDLLIPEAGMVIPTKQLGVMLSVLSE